MYCVRPYLARLYKKPLYRSISRHETCSSRQSSTYLQECQVCMVFGQGSPSSSHHTYPYMTEPCPVGNGFRSARLARVRTVSSVPMTGAGAVRAAGKHNPRLARTGPGKKEKKEQKQLMKAFLRRSVGTRQRSRPRSTEPTGRSPVWAPAHGSRFSAVRALAHVQVRGVMLPSKVWTLGKTGMTAPVSGRSVVLKGERYPSR